MFHSLNSIFDRETKNVDTTRNPQGVRSFLLQNLFLENHFASRKQIDRCLVRDCVERPTSDAGPKSDRGEFVHESVSEGQRNRSELLRKQVLLNGEVQHHEQRVVRQRAGGVVFVVASFVNRAQAVAIDAAANADFLDALDRGGGDDGGGVAGELEKRSEKPVDDDFADVESSGGARNEGIDDNAGLLCDLGSNVAKLEVQTVLECCDGSEEVGTRADAAVLEEELFRAEKGVVAALPGLGGLNAVVATHNRVRDELDFVEDCFWEMRRIIRG